jgi:hypothetical protein
MRYMRHMRSKLNHCALLYCIRPINLARGLASRSRDATNKPNIQIYMQIVAPLFVLFKLPPLGPEQIDPRSSSSDNVVFAT